MLADITLSIFFFSFLDPLCLGPVLTSNGVIMKTPPDTTVLRMDKGSQCVFRPRY